MKRIGFLMACGLLASVVGCDNRTNPPVDSGGIVLMDSGSGDPDTGTPPMPDSGTPPTGCSVDVSTSLPPLPAACLPRCSSATVTCIMGCADGACQRACVDADTTAGTTLNASGESIPLDCSGCWDWGIQHCVFVSCPSELAGCAGCADQCNPDTAGCETEEAAIDSCITANQTAIQSCFNTQATRCFPG